MAGGAWGLLCLTFSSLTARGWCESQPLEVSYLVSATTIPSYFCFGRDKLLVQIPLTATSCHFPNSRQLWPLMPWNQPRLSTNCSQAVFLARGTYSHTLKNMSNKCLSNEWNIQTFSFITKAEGTDSSTQLSGATTDYSFSAPFKFQRLSRYRSRLRQTMGEEEGKVPGVLLSWDLFKQAPR